MSLGDLVFYVIVGWAVLALLLLTIVAVCAARFELRQWRRERHERRRRCEPRAGVVVLADVRARRAARS